VKSCQQGQHCLEALLYIIGVVRNRLAEFVDDMSGSSCFHAQERMEQVFAVPVVDHELADASQELGCGPNTVRMA